MIVPGFYMDSADQTLALAHSKHFTDRAISPVPRFGSRQAPYEVGAYLDTSGQRAEHRSEGLSHGGYIVTEELRAGFRSEWLMEL